MASKCHCGRAKGKNKGTCYQCEYQRVRQVKYQDKKDLIVAYKSVPCHDCGGKFKPHVMDFDHVDGTKKKFNISANVLKQTMESILEEIAKCDVVCSNCHRERTHKRLHGKKNERVGQP